MYHNQKFIVNVWGSQNAFYYLYVMVLCIFREGVMMIPCESKHVAQGQ